MIFKTIGDEFMDKVKELINLGVEEKRRGNYVPALRYYNEALQIDKSNPEIYNAMGKTNFILGEYENAFSNFIEAAMLSAQYIDVDVLFNNSTDIENIIRQSNVKSQVMSLINNLGKHCGFSNIALDYLGLSTAPIPHEERHIINAALLSYRRDIDPIFNPGNIPYSQEELDVVENFAIEKGTKVFNIIAKSENNKNLEIITNLYLQ